MEHITSAGIIVTNRVFVGGIPNWMNEVKLQLEFEQMGFNVKDTRIVEDMRTGRPKGYGFVTFYEAKVAEDLIKESYVVTKDGLRFRIAQAIRKKALELKQQQMFKDSYIQSNMMDIQYTYMQPMQTMQTPLSAPQALQAAPANGSWYCPTGGYTYCLPTNCHEQQYAQNNCGYQYLMTCERQGPRALP